jgi:hypothetical protein
MKMLMALRNDLATLCNPTKEALRQALTPEVTPEVTPDVDNAYTKLDTSDRVLHKTNVPQP